MDDCRAAAQRLDSGRDRYLSFACFATITSLPRPPAHADRPYCPFPQSPRSEPPSALARAIVLRVGLAMPAVAVPGQPSPLGRPPQSTSTTLPPFHHPPSSSAQPGSSASPTQSHRSMSSLSSSNGASFHSSLQQPSLQAQQQPPPGSPRGAVAPPLRSVDSSRTVQLADGTMGLSREQSLRGQVGVMSLPPPSAVSRGGAGGPVWNPPLASPGLATRNVDEFWGNPKRLSSNGSSNGWDVDPSASELAGQGGGAGAGAGGPGSVEDELEMALRRSPLVNVSRHSTHSCTALVSVLGRFFVSDPLFRGDLCCSLSSVASRRPSLRSST